MVILIFRNPDVQKMVDLLQNSWLNPFSHGSQPPPSFSTSTLPSDDTTDDLTKAYQVGEAAYEEFQKNRLEPENPLVKFHDTLKKHRFKTFTNLSRKKRTKTSKGCETVFHKFRPQPLIMIAETHGLHRQEVLLHPLSWLPASLATGNGLPYKSNEVKRLAGSLIS